MMSESGSPVRRIARAVVVGCAAALSILHGCFVEIADPIPLMNDASTDSGGSANGGSSAGSSGSSATGGTAGGSGGTGGSSGGTGGSSASGSGGTAGAACDATSCSLPHADATCATDGRCVITACHPGFLDCNGDPTDGCELGAVEAPDLDTAPGNDAEAGDGAVTYLIPSLKNRPSFYADAGLDPLWNDLSPIRFATACSECDNPPTKPGGLDGAPIGYPGVVPLATMHLGYFRVGYNQSSLFVLATVWDSEIIDDTTTFDAGAEAGSDAGILPGADAEHEDGIELMIDAPDLNCPVTNCPNYQQYDHHLFIGASGRMVQYVNSTKPPAPSLKEVIVKAERIPGGACYVIEAELTESYIGPLTVVPGATFGFAIAVNDWRTLLPGTLPQRVYQVFWKKPGTTYGFVVTGFPQVEFAPVTEP